MDAGCLPIERRSGVRRWKDSRWEKCLWPGRKRGDPGKIKTERRALLFDLKRVQHSLNCAYHVHQKGGHKTAAGIDNSSAKILVIPALEVWSKIRPTAGYPSQGIVNIKEGNLKNAKCLILKTLISLNMFNMLFYCHFYIYIYVILIF